MRRRRPQLGVSLFPFLSVLLCTLGSLILLLLVLDQQARRQRQVELRLQQEAREAARREQTESQRRLAEQLADAARRLQELREEARRQAETIRRQCDFLRDECQDSQRLLQALHDQLHAVQTDHAALQDRLEALGREQQHWQGSLEALRGETDATQRRKQNLEAETALLREQIAALERLVARLREAAQKPPPRVYSLIPYRGRLGAARKPIYVECVGQQAHFRPDGPSLFVTDLLDPSRLEDEIRRRSSGLAAAPKPYVLLLVRPSGIPTYYLVLRHLAKADVDLGYELIEEDWVLDFSEPTAEDLLAEERRSAEQRPWVGPLSPKPPTPLPRTGDGSVSAGARGQGSAPASTSGSSGAGQPPRSEAPGSGNPGKVRVARPLPLGGAAADDKPFVLECRAEGVVFWPEKTTIPTTDLLRPVPPTATHPFLAEMNTLLDRRRRAGQLSPARVRVLVRPDGLRTYYRLASLLETLPVRSEVETIRADTNIEALLP